MDQPASDNSISRSAIKVIAAKGRGVVLLFLAMLICTGCPPKINQPKVKDPISLNSAIDIYNTNIKSIRPFKAKLTEWEIKFTEQGKENHYNEYYGYIFFSPPQENQQRASLRLKADWPMGTAWTLGSNNEEYWMTIEPNKSGWWGNYKHLGKPCSGIIPIDPQYILEMVGLRKIPYQIDKPPYPVYKIYPEHYIIEYLEPFDNNKLWLQREIIISRRTDRPEEINVYDKSGRRIGQSLITKYNKLENAWLPADIQLNYPAADSFIRLEFSDFKLKNNFKPRLFERPKNPSGIHHYLQIDKKCDKEYDNE